MKKLAFGTQAVVRAWLLCLGCAGIVAACSSSSDSPDTTTAGSAGTAGDAQAGKNSGGTQAGSTQGGKAGAGQGGKSGGTAGMAGKTSNQAGEAGAGAGEAGASGAGVGGENAGGSPGEAGAAGAGGSGTPACEEGAFCDVAVGCAFSGKCKNNVCMPIDAKLATIDQSLVSGFPDTWNLADSMKMGQFITMGKTGLLTGVELSLGVDCKAMTGNLDLNVYDATSKALLGTGTVAISTLACEMGGNLDANKIGQAFWDLSSKCISVKAGQKIRVELRSATMGACVADHCVGGPYPAMGCNSDLFCTGMSISASEPSTYAGGSIAMGDTPGSSDDNLLFKTWVLE